MPFGAQLTEAGTRFRLWAPSARRVVLHTHSPQGGELQADLSPAGEGWYELVVGGVGPGTLYRYRIDDEADVPDPASRRNPEGVHGASEVTDPAAFQWSDGAWRGRPWHEAVLYELHVGTFTPQGTYAAVAERLDDLDSVGVTAIELLPLACFAGQRGWGYDGVLPFAPHPAYGTPEDLKRLIQAAHERGIMMVLDVVYNHFGPEGNYLSRYAREFFTHEAHTPWGDAIDFGRAQVRRFFIENALYWLEEFHFDGLRLDAVHAIHDSSAKHFIDELVEEVHAGPGRDRHVHVVLENHSNEAQRLTVAPLEGTKDGRTNVAQWNDDFHHPLHVVLTGERDGYYADFAAAPLEQLARVLAEGFAFQGEYSGVSEAQRGERCAHLPPTAFVSFLQNHDQIGNRAFGERLATQADPQHLKAALAVLLLAPQIPMLFMGEEYGAAQPFLYFCDFTGELGTAVREGRRKEFAAFSAFTDSARRAEIPDPNALDTFERSRLVWADRATRPGADWLSYVRDLLRVRTREVVPWLPQLRAGTAQIREGVLSVTWPAAGQSLSLQMNCSGQRASVQSRALGDVRFTTAHESVADALQPWEVRVLRTA